LSGEDHPMHGRTGEDHPTHGHKLSGEDHPNSKLTNNEASAVKWYALNSTLSRKEIAQMFGVGSSSVGDIARDESWPNLDPKPPADNGQLRLPLGAT
jgi:hypothetical protein